MVDLPRILTMTKVRAARAAMDSAEGPAPAMFYATLPQWLDLGGDPATFDALPTVDFGKDPANG